MHLNLIYKAVIAAYMTKNIITESFIKKKKKRASIDQSLYKGLQSRLVRDYQKYLNKCKYKNTTSSYTSV